MWWNRLDRSHRLGYFSLVSGDHFSDVVLDSVRLAVYMPGSKRICELIVFFTYMIYSDISLPVVQPVSIVGDIWRKDVFSDLTLAHIFLNVNLHTLYVCVGLSTSHSVSAV